MSWQLIAIVLGVTLGAAGIALGGLIWWLGRSLRAELKQWIYKSLHN
jgi:hypothetical protein